MPVSFNECLDDLQQLQTSTYSSDTESKLEFRGRTAQSFFAIFEHHAVYYIEEIRGNVGYATGSYEECDEKLSDMTAAIDLVYICIVLSACNVS